MTPLRRKHLNLAERCADYRRRGYVVDLRVYQECEHWKLGYKVFTGEIGFPCQQGVIAAAETESAIRELRTAFEVEMQSELVEAGR